MALTDGLQGYWKVDESSGDAADSSGNGRTLTNTNTVAYAAGKINNAADTGSTNTNKKLGTSNFIGLTASTNYSFNFWVNITTNPSNGTEAGMLSWCDNSTLNGKIYYQVKFYNNAGTVEYYITRNNVTTQNQTGASASMTVGTWYMLTYTWDGGTHALYKNGNSTPVLTQATTITGTNSNNGGTDGLKLFTEQDNSAYFSGLLDEIGVWNRALSTSEISELYNGGAGLSYPFAAASTDTRDARKLALLGVG